MKIQVTFIVGMLATALIFLGTGEMSNDEAANTTGGLYCTHTLFNTGCPNGHTGTACNQVSHNTAHQTCFYWMDIIPSNATQDCWFKDDTHGNACDYKEGHKNSGTGCDQHIACAPFT